MVSSRTRATLLIVVLVLPVAVATVCVFAFGRCDMDHTSDETAVKSTMDCCVSCFDLATQEMVKSRLNELVDGTFLLVQDGHTSIVREFDHVALSNLLTYPIKGPSLPLLISVFQI